MNKQEAGASDLDIIAEPNVELKSEIPLMTADLDESVDFNPEVAKPVDSWRDKFRNFIKGIFKKKELGLVEPDKNIKHYQSMFFVWEKIREKPESFHNRIVNEDIILTFLQDPQYLRMFSILIQAKDKSKNDIGDFLNQFDRPLKPGEDPREVYLGASQKLKETAGAQKLDNSADKAIRKITEARYISLSNFENSSRAEFYENQNQFKDLTLDEHYFLASLLYLDYNALFEEQKGEPGLFRKLRNFMQARENLDKINDCMFGLEDHYKRELENDPDKFLDNLKKKDEVTDEDAEKLAERIYFLKYVPELPKPIIKALEKEFRGLSWRIIVKSYLVQKILEDKERSEQKRMEDAMSLLRRYTGITDKEAEKAINILRSGGWKEADYGLAA